jgi:hypothetical protein
MSITSRRVPRRRTGADAVSSGRAQRRLSAAGETAMQGPNLERWQELCREAAEEQDPKRLLELIAEINRLLEEKERRLITEGTPKDGKKSV